MSFTSKFMVDLSSEHLMSTWPFTKYLLRSKYTDKYQLATQRTTTDTIN